MARAGTETLTMMEKTMKNAIIVSLLLAISPLASPAIAASHAPVQTEAQAADQRIQTLQAGLQITPAQTPQWTSFTQAMRDNATATDALFRERATSAGTMSAADNMKSYATVARAYADNTQKLSDAFQTLYNTLSDPQKQAADTMFRQQPAKK